MDELKDQGETCSKNRVARRLKHLKLRAKAKKKFKVTTDSKHNLPVSENILNRNFSANVPNQKWCGDITYIWTSEGWIYLAVVIDLYSRAVIGWSIHTFSHPLVCATQLFDNSVDFNFENQYFKRNFWRLETRKMKFIWFVKRTFL